MLKVLAGLFMKNIIVKSLVFFSNNAYINLIFIKKTINSTSIAFVFLFSNVLNSIKISNRIF